MAATSSGIQGFNSGAFKIDYSAKSQADFEEEMTTAQELHGSPGLFNSIRLYTNIQYETDSDPIAAFDAALATNTTLLLGFWCSDVESMENELKALTTALEDKGQEFADLVVGISVGSEDLYRISEDGIDNDAGIGAGPDTIAGFIREVREKLGHTLLADKPIGHVDTWSAWGNSSNKDVLDQVDFVGVDLYPYYEDDKGNSFENMTNVWDYIYGVAKDAADEAGVPLWITETGWPLSGDIFGEAVASVDNARDYWRQIGCSLFGRENVWWYNLGDSNPDNEEKFAITSDFSTTAEFELTCPSDSGAPAAINMEDMGSNTTGLSLSLLVGIVVLATAGITW
jgi:glucan endo-1,3-beta-D-glucosidase